MPMCRPRMLDSLDWRDSRMCRMVEMRCHWSNEHYTDTAPVWTKKSE